MDRIREQVNRRRRELVVVASFAGAVGLLSIMANIDGAADGEVVAFARSSLALGGIAGAALVWTRPGGLVGWMLLMAWAVIQIPVYAWSDAGSPTEQFVRLPLTVASRTTVNGVTTEYSEIGINLVGLILAIVTYRWRAAIQQGWRVETPSPSL